MPNDKPRYYTTTVNASRTVNQIIGILQENDEFSGAVTKSDSNGEPEAIRFVIQTDGTELPVEYSADTDFLQDEYDMDGGKARMVARRQLKHHVESQMMLLKSGQRSAHEVFMADALVQDNGRVMTAGELFEEQPEALIPDTPMLPG